MCPLYVGFVLINRYFTLWALLTLRFGFFRTLLLQIRRIQESQRKRKTAKFEPNPLHALPIKIGAQDMLQLALKPAEGKAGRDKAISAIAELREEALATGKCVNFQAFFDDVMFAPRLLFAQRESPQRCLSLTLPSFARARPRFRHHRIPHLRFIHFRCCVDDVQESNEILVLQSWSTKEDLDKFAEGPAFQKIAPRWAGLLVEEPVAKTYSNQIF